MILLAYLHHTAFMIISLIQDKQTLPGITQKQAPFRATIVIPPVFDFYFTGHRFSGLGAEILSSLLQENRCSVQLLNFPLQTNQGQTRPLPGALGFLKPHIIENETGRLSFFTRYQRFGPSLEECTDRIVISSPDIVFISCFAFCYADAALELASSVRAALPGIPIVIGGAGVSAFPDFFIRRPAVDFALTGEAEVSIPGFLNAIRSNSAAFESVPNLYHKCKGDIITPAVQQFTGPADISFILKKTKITKQAVYYTTSISRGCLKTCRFCSNFLCHGRQFRVIPLEKIQRRLSDISIPAEERDKTIYVNFEDDNLLLAPDYFLAVLELFNKKFSRVCFLAENGMDYTRLSPDLIKTLIKLGMKQFNLSIASTHDPILENEGRAGVLPLFERIVQILDAHQIRTITYFICGFTQDSKTTVVDNIAYLAKLPTLLGISLFYPVPGIPDFTDKTIFERCPAFLCAGSAAYPWNQSLTTAELVTAFRLSRMVNLLKSGHRTEMENTLIRKIVRERRLYTSIRRKGARSIEPVPNAADDMVDMFFNCLPAPLDIQRHH